MCVCACVCVCVHACVRDDLILAGNCGSGIESCALCCRTIRSKCALALSYSSSSTEWKFSRACGMIVIPQCYMARLYCEKGA